MYRSFFEPRSGDILSAPGFSRGTLSRRQDKSPVGAKALDQRYSSLSTAFAPTALISVSRNVFPRLKPGAGRMSPLCGLVVLLILLISAGTTFAQASAAHTYVFPRFSDRPNSRFLVGDLGGQPATVDATFYNAVGNKSQTATFEVGAGSFLRLSPDDFRALGVTDFSGGVVFNSSQSLSVVETLEDASGTIENIADSVFSNRLILPFSEGSIGSAQLTLFNNGTAETQVVLGAIGVNGETLATAQLAVRAHGILNVTLDSVMRGLFQPGNPVRRDVSHVLVLTPTNVLGNDKGLYAIATLSGYGSESENVVARRDPALINALNMSSGTLESTVPLFVHNGDYFSMIQVINMTQQSGLVTLTARDENGNVLAAGRNPATFALPGSGSIRLNAANIFDFGQNSFMGSITISANVQSIVTSAIGTNSQLGFAVTPAVTAPATDWVFVTRASTGWVSQYAVRNQTSGNANLTLSFINDGGFGISEITRVVPPGAALIKTLSELFAGVGGDGFVVIQSSVPVTAEVLEARVDGAQLTAISPAHLQPGFSRPATNRFLASGYVTHEGVALSNVSVQITGPANFTTTTDSSGAFAFTDLPSGKYTIRAQAVGYTFTPTELAINITTDSSRDNIVAAILTRPAIANVAPGNLTVDAATTQVTISGGPFLPTSVVYFEGKPVPTVVGGTNSVVAIFDASLLKTIRTAQLYVMNAGPGGSVASSPTNFSVEPPRPIIDTLSGVPDPLMAGNPGFVMTMNGSGFLAGAVVWMGNQTLFTVFVSSNALQVTVPPQALAAEGVLTFTVYNPGLSTGPSNPVTLMVRTPSATLTSISPDQGDVRLDAGGPPMQMTLIGSGFRPNATVLFGTSELVPSYISSSQLLLTIPPSALQVGGLIPVSVKNPAPTLGSSNPMSFSLRNVAPELTSIQTTPLSYDSSKPTESYQAQVILRGNNFGLNTIVEVSAPCAGQSGFVPTAGSIVGSQELVARVTIACAGTYLVRVQTGPPGGGISQELSFVVAEYVPGSIPTIASLSATSIAAGTGTFAIVISGTNFASGAVVNFGTTALNPSSITPNRIIVTIPASLVAAPGNFPISVSNPNAGGTSNTVLFTVY